MKKFILSAVLVAFAASYLFAEFSVKGNLTVGSTIVESTDDDVEFGGAYALADVSGENDFISIGGKFYYRLNATDDIEKLSQKLEIKKAFVKVRPFRNNLLEIGGGKLYSYYLPGNYFQLAEIYTGASRWGKTGVGIKSEIGGFFGGIGIPLTESYVAFTDNFGINGAAGFDFKKVNSDVPVKLSGDVVFTRIKQKDESYENETSSTFSVNYAPSFNGTFSKINLTASYSINAEPYVASSVFKNVSNYNAENLKKANFASLNFRADIGKVQWILEGEAGHSVEGDLIPLYAGTQVLIPVIKHFDLKPRFFYYAAFDSEDSGNSRNTFEFYPRIWLTFGNWIISAGYDFDFKQDEDKDWIFEWNIPVYVEYKFKH